MMIGMYSHVYGYAYVYLYVYLHLHLHLHLCVCVHMCALKVGLATFLQVTLECRVRTLTPPGSEEKL